MSDVNEDPQVEVEVDGDGEAPARPLPVEAMMLPLTKQLRVPLVKVETAELRIDTMPNGHKVLLIGPVIMAVPLSPDNQRFLKEQMSGIVIAAPGDLLQRDV